MRVLIPWRPTASRLEPYRQVRSAYEALGCEVSMFDSGHETFNLAASRNLAMSTALPGEVVAIADADTLPDGAALTAAVGAAAGSGLVHLPYTRYWRPGLFEAACSGIFVATSDAYYAAGGMDERFDAWGPEDFAFQVAHRTLLGRDLVRHDGDVYALQHEGDWARGPRLEARFRMYFAHRGDVTAMRRITAENVDPTRRGARSGWVSAKD